MLTNKRCNIPKIIQVVNVIMRTEKIVIKTFFISPVLTNKKSRLYRIKNAPILIYLLFYKVHSKRQMNSKMVKIMGSLYIFIHTITL